MKVRIIDSFEADKYHASDEIFPSNTHRVLDITGPQETFPQQRRLHHSGGGQFLLAAPGDKAPGAAGDSERSLRPGGVHVCLQHATR